MRTLALRRCARVLRSKPRHGHVLRLRGRVGQRRTGSTDRDGSDPAVRGPAAGSGPGVFAHPCPLPLGSLPASSPVREGLSAPLRGGGSRVRSLATSRHGMRLPRPVWKPSCKGPIDRRSPEGGWDGSAHPNPPRATLGTEIGGSLRSRPQVLARHRDPGDRSTTARPPATCGIGGVPIRNAFPRTSTPVSHVTLWIGIGRVENRLQFTAPCPRSGSTSVAGKAPRYRHDFRKDPTRSDALVWHRWPLSAKFPVCRSCSPSSKGIE